MKSVSTSLFLALLAAPLLIAQAPKLEIERIGDLWQLDYQLSPQAGATMLHFSLNLFDLKATYDRILDIPAASGPLTLDFSPLANGPSGFFSIYEFPGLMAADFAANDDDPVIEEMTFFLQVTSAIRGHFNLLAGNGSTSVTANFNGTATLCLHPSEI